MKNRLVWVHKGVEISVGTQKQYDGSLCPKSEPYCKAWTLGENNVSINVGSSTVKNALL